MAECGNLSVSVDEFAEVLQEEERWYELGIFLKASMKELNAINRHYSTCDILMLYIQLYGCLEKKGKSLSWESIAESLRKMGNHSLAEKIHTQYIKPRSTLQEHSTTTNQGTQSLLSYTTDVAVNTSVPIIHSDPADPPIQSFDNKPVCLIANECKSLITKFQNIVFNVKLAVRNENIDLDSIQDIMKFQCGLPPLPQERATVDAVFTRVAEQCSILNFHVLEFIVRNLLNGRKKFIKQLTTLKRSVEIFKSSANMVELVTLIKSKQTTPTGGQKRVELKVREFWHNFTYKQFEIIVNEIFQTLYDIMTHITVKKGCICLNWIIPDINTTELVPLLPLEFIQLIGVIHLHIGSKTIYHIEGDGCESIKAAMLQAIEIKNTRAIELLLAVGCSPQVATYTDSNTVTNIVNIKAIENKESSSGRSGGVDHVCILGHNKHVEAIIDPISEPECSPCSVKEKLIKLLHQEVESLHNEVTLQMEKNEKSESDSKANQVKLVEEIKLKDGKKPEEYLETIEKLKRDNEELRIENRKHEDYTSIIIQRHKEKESLQKSLEEIEKERADLAAEFKQIQGEKDEATEECESVKQKLEMMAQDQSQLKEENDKWSEKCEMLEKMFKGKLRESDSERGKLEKHIQDSDQKLKEKEKENDDLLKKISELQESLMEQKRNIDELEDQCNTLKDEFNKRIPLLSFYHENDRAAANYPPIAMVMTNFSDHKKKDIQWFSPPFYSHKGGYKLSVKIDANGKEGGRGTHLSASIHVMKGEYDDQLDWPLTAEVQLELLNRYTNSGHRRVTLRFNESSSRESRERVYSGVITDSGTCATHGICEERLIKHADLESQYFKDDSIFVRVNSVQIITTQPSRAMPETPLHVSTEVHEFTLSNFSKLKAKNEKWKSKPFYTHDNGYKFVMVVYPNGEFTYKGSHIAFFLHLMKGENDDRLSFPFRGTIYVQLVNRIGDHSHAEFPVKFNEENDPNGKHGARVSKYSTDKRHSTDGWGTGSFIRYDLLPRDEYRNTEYLRNDELVFRIPKIKVYSS